MINSALPSSPPQRSRARSRHRSGWPGYAATGTWLRRAARALELRSVGLAHEQFSPQEGLRAGLAIALPLAAALLAGQRWLAWAVFAAFWTCLCDAPAPHAQRRRQLSAFVVAGTAVTLIGSWSASWSAHAALISAPVLVWLTVSVASTLPFGALLGTLLAVVAVVATGFPQTLALAARQAGGFLLGAAWAYALINMLWRIDERIPLRQAARATLTRMLDMAHALPATSPASHERHHRHPHGEHRRAVRMALERWHRLLQRHAQTSPASVVAHHHCLQACEDLFAALIALEHAALTQAISPRQQRRLASLARLVLRHGQRRLWSHPVPPAAPERGATRSTGRAVHYEDALCRGIQRALTRARAVLQDGVAIDASTNAASTPDGAPGSILPSAMRSGLRQASGVAAVFYMAQLCHLGYPYWATMAVVVVLQNPPGLTWSRCLERMAGSVLGGILAGTLLHVVGSSGSTAILPLLAVILGGLAIALRLVNYTVFVVFLTMLFIVVTEMLQHGSAIAWTRVVDNLIGSGVALLAALTLWPEFGATLRERIAMGLRANRAYRAAVAAQLPAATIGQLQRQAGLASVDAEIALHELGGLRRRWSGLSERDMRTLRALRHLAGTAALDWHRRARD